MIRPGIAEAEGVFVLDGPLDLRLTLGPLQRGRADPAVRIDASGSGAWLCRRATSPDEMPGPGAGPRPAVTMRLDQLDEHRVRVRTWARESGIAAEAQADAAALLGGADGWSRFDALLEESDDPTSEALRRVRRHHPGLRLPAAGQLGDQVVTVVLEQKVTHDQARSSWRHLLRAYGEHPPGPTPEGMRVPPTAETLRSIPSWQWHRMWVQPPLARTVVQVAAREAALRRLERMTTGPEAVGELAQRLTRIPGVGPWTVAETLQRSHGAADLISVGDYHLAHHVGEALTGRRTDDAGMLRLLAPWAGHRQRVVRLIGLSRFRPQRFGPKLAPADHRRR